MGSRHYIRAVLYGDLGFGGVPDPARQPAAARVEPGPPARKNIFQGLETRYSPSIMKRDIEWKERLDGGVKRIVRVKFLGQGKIKWQFKRSDEDLWDYDSPATPADWETLEEKVDNLYQRNRCALRDRELVKKMREEHG